ncbi:hypothetical protein AVEN_156918-1 [Araneus ventricosus]|uniref:RNase H type-1 domain-containing protein n=1 Tax=Araneus ventricosus TaxID=182803 RepID=A0A4Y2ENJ8_ARAVE|nr:hypothetical protein AVEN_156918-1 [Araneus ventricosus]
MALEFISTIGSWNKINLYADSLLVLEALNTFKTSKQEILAIKKNILEMRKSKSITLHWIPAHSGIQGNETADSYAQNSTTRPNIEKIPKKSFKQLKKCNFQCANTDLARALGFVHNRKRQTYRKTNTGGINSNEKI